MYKLVVHKDHRIQLETNLKSVFIKAKWGGHKMRVLVCTYNALHYHGIVAHI